MLVGAGLRGEEKGKIGPCLNKNLSLSSGNTVAILEDALRKVPPQSLDAEESVLGGILLDTTALDRVVEMMGTDDFYRESHRKIFRAMLALNDRGEPIDLITLTDTLKARGELQEIGGATYVAELVEKIPSAANIAH